MLLNLLEKVSLLQEKNSSKNLSLLVMGDNNYPEIDFEQCTLTTSADSSPARFLDKIQDMFLIQNVLKPTRVRKDQVPSLLDLVFTDEENLIDDIEYQVPVGLSDHACLSWTLATSKATCLCDEEKRNFWAGNYDEINRKLDTINWDELFEDETTETMWTKFVSVLSNLTLQHIPLKSDKNNNRKDKRISNKTVKLMKERVASWKNYRTSPTELNYSKYKDIRNRVNSLVRKDQTMHREKSSNLSKETLNDFTGTREICRQ